MCVCVCVCVCVCQNSGTLARGREGVPEFSGTVPRTGVPKFWHSWHTGTVPTTGVLKFWHSWHTGTVPKTGVPEILAQLAHWHSANDWCAKIWATGTVLETGVPEFWKLCGYAGASGPLAHGRPEACQTVNFWYAHFRQRASPGPDFWPTPFRPDVPDCWHTPFRQRASVPDVPEIWHTHFRNVPGRQTCQSRVWPP